MIVPSKRGAGFKMSSYIPRLGGTVQNGTRQFFVVKMKGCRHRFRLAKLHSPSLEII